MPKLDIISHFDRYHDGRIQIVLTLNAVASGYPGGSEDCISQMFIRPIRKPYIFCTRGLSSDWIPFSVPYLQNLSWKHVHKKKVIIFLHAVLNKNLIHHLLLTNKQGLVHLHKVLMLVQDCHSKNKQLPNTGSEKQTITGSESLDHVGMQFALPMLILCCQYNDQKAYIIVLNCRHRVHYSLFKSEL